MKYKNASLLARFFQQIFFSNSKILFGFILLNPVSLLSQPLDSIIQSGIAQHDQKNYTQAIRTFQSALKLDEKSSQASYELSYTYFTIKDYSRAIKFARKSISDARPLLPDAYIIWGSALDEMKKYTQAVLVYNQGMERFPSHQLLQYNLGLTQYRMKSFPEAEKTLAQSIRLNPLHPGSHLLLSFTETALGNRVKAILPLYFFLLLEPNSERSAEAWQQLVYLQSLGVKKSGPHSFQIQFDPGQKGEVYNQIDMAIHAAIVKSISQEKDTSQLGIFCLRNELIFGILPDSSEYESDLWTSFYIPFFHSLHREGYTRPFSCYISQAELTDDTREWFMKHPEETDHFGMWVEANLK